MIDKTNSFLNLRSEFRQFDTIKKKCIIDFMLNSNQTCPLCNLNCKLECCKKLFLKHVSYQKSPIKKFNFEEFNLDLFNLQINDPVYSVMLNNQKKLFAIWYIKYLKERKDVLDVNVLYEQYRIMKNKYKKMIDSDDWRGLFSIKDNLLEIIKVITKSDDK